MRQREQRGYLFRKGQSWFVRYCDDVLVSGKVQRKLVCKKLPVEYGGEYRTKASVKGFVNDILRPVNAGTLNPQSTMTLAEFVDGAYFDWAVKNLRECTVYGYKKMWRNYLKARVGKFALRDFRTMHGERLMQDLAAQHKLGRRTLAHNKAFLSGVFLQARRLGILDSLNPMQGVSIPRTAEPAETHAYSLAEVNLMLTVLADDLMARTAVMVAALTGLSKSEITGLEWRDFTGEVITVNRSNVDGVTDETKTRARRAPVPVVPMLADALHTLRTKMGVLAQQTSPIFQAGNGKPANLDNVAQRIIRPALAGTGVTFHGWHAFRREFSTMIQFLGADVKTAQTLLRHSNPQVTLAHYTKAINESKVKAATSLERALLAETNEQNRVTCNNLTTPQHPLIN